MSRLVEDHLLAEQLAPGAKAWLLHHDADFSKPFPLAGRAGSGRQYYRVAHAEGSAVVMVSPEVDLDFDRFVQISRYLLRCGIEVPQLHAIDLAQKQIVMEDLGGVQLHQLLLDRTTRDAGLDVGLQTLDSLQRRCALFDREGPELLLDRSFDFEALRWETDYFSDHYLSGVMGWSEEERSALLEEFDQLALRVSRHPTVLMHRDFQSQNLMVVRGVDPHGQLDGEPLFLGVIDYQGARAGSCWYDLASLLWDPYVGLESAAVRRSWEQWCALKKISAGNEEWQQFLEASLQRLMQACGAYGRLGHREGIAFFQQWIVPGARQLHRAISALPGIDFLKLRAAITRIVLQE